MFRGLIFAVAALALSLSEPVNAQTYPAHFVDVPEARLWVSDTGGSGEPVVLLHAHTGTSESWVKQIPALVKAGYRVIAYDRAGSGKSVLRPGMKPLSSAEDLDALADALKLDTFDIVAVAHGGYVAADYAAWRPKRVKSLVVAASGLGIPVGPKGDAAADALRTRSALPGFAQWPPEVRELSPSYRGINPDGVARWKEIEKHSMQPGAIDPPPRTPNTYGKIASLTMPILVVAGDVDLTTPSAAIRLWAKHLKAYDWALIPEAGHSVNWEQPDAFNAAVIGFLNKHRG